MSSPSIASSWSLKTCKIFFETLWHKVWRHPYHLFFVLLAYLPFLNSMSVPLTGDQKLYLSTALEMRETGRWLKPLLWGDPSYFKPPFQFWATLVGWKVVGFSLAGALLPSVLALLGTAYCLGEISYLLRERRWFVNSGIVFAATLGAATFANVAQMEIWVCFFYAAAWWTGIRYLSDPLGTRHRGWLYAAFALAGISALVKSPLYSVFWVTGYLTYLLIAGEWEIFRSKHLYAAGFLGVALGAAWYVAILGIDGHRFWTEYLMRETWEKKGGNQSGVLGIWGALLYFSFPFTLMLIPALRTFGGKRRTGNILRFMIAWAWPPAIFFTLYPYRVNTYLFILVPLCALVIDWGYFRVGRSRFYRAMMIASGIVAALSWTTVAWVVIRGELAPVWVAMGLVFSGVLLLVCAAGDRMRGLALAGLLAVFFLRAAAISMGEQDIEPLRVAAVLLDDAPLAMLDEKRNIWHERGLLSVALEQPIARLDTVVQAVDFLAKGGWLILSDEQSEAFLVPIRQQLSARGIPNDLQENLWPRWKGRMKFPYRDFILNGKSGVPDFEAQTHRYFKIVGVLR